MSDESSLTATFRGLLPNLGRMESMLTQILDLEGHESFRAIDPAATPESAYIRDRVFANARLLRHRLATIDPLLLSEGGLANINVHIAAELNELTNFAANRNLGHLVNARAQLDGNVYPYLWAIFPESGTGPLDSAQLARIREVEEFAQQAIRDVSAERDAAQAATRDQFAKAIEDVAHEQEKLVATMAVNAVELRAAMTKASDDLSTLAEKIAQQRSDNEAAIAKLEKEFSEAEQKRGERSTSLLAQQSNDYATRSNEADKEVGALIERLSEKEQEVIKLVEAIGTKGITANYAVIAERELKSANRWRWATIAFFVLGIGIAAYIFFKILPASLDHLNLGEIALRFGFALAITAPAIYTARESARHRTTGDRATQAQMELASLGPFIANLDRDSQDSIRRDLVEKYFGREHEAYTAEPPIKLKEMGSLAVELVKATREAGEKRVK